MPLTLNQEDGGKVLVIRATGKLVEADYKDFVPEFEHIASHGGNLRVLFDMIGLEGWDAAAAWDDIKFDIKHFGDISRLAMIGNKKWQHGLAIFFSPFTKAKTRYFDQSDAAEARRWLAEA